LQWGLRDPRKKRLTPLIELGEEFLGTQHRAGRGMRLDPRSGDEFIAVPNRNGSRLLVLEYQNP
jgi:hypothetical protein